MTNHREDEGQKASKAYLMIVDKSYKRHQSGGATDDETERSTAEIDET